MSEVRITTGVVARAPTSNRPGVVEQDDDPTNYSLCGRKNEAMVVAPDVVAGCNARFLVVADGGGVGGTLS